MKGTLEAVRDVIQLQKIIKGEVVVEMGSKSWQCGGEGAERRMLRYRDTDPCMAQFPPLSPA